MKRVAFAVSFITIGALGEAQARADEHATCDAAFEASELQLRPSETHLLQARESLRACALPNCQAWMVDDCTKRLVEVEGRIPSIVFSADNGHGTPIYDVRIVEGERELAAQIDGRAVEMDPGPHALVATHGDVQVPLTVVAIEGKKAQQIVFTFPEAAPPPPVATVPVAPPTQRPEDLPLAHPWARPVSIVLLAGGVLAAGIGVGFGVAAINKKSDAHCNDNDVCQGNFHGALDAAHASTASFIVGGALFAGGLATYFVFGRTRLSASFGAVRIGTTW